MHAPLLPCAFVALTPCTQGGPRARAWFPVVRAASSSSLPLSSPPTVCQGIGGGGTEGAGPQNCCAARVGPRADLGMAVPVGGAGPVLTQPPSTWRSWSQGQAQGLADRRSAAWGVG